MLDRRAASRQRGRRYRQMHVCEGPQSWESDGGRRWLFFGRGRTWRRCWGYGSNGGIGSDKVKVELSLAGMEWFRVRVGGPKLGWS